mmetsp:Transcript_12469/g.18606  ORF Transcript_12469/g.18606 Transcript_12469/m.18606 type:complete len:124 (-) Transcript_12469:150-521(-)
MGESDSQRTFHLFLADLVLSGLVLYAGYLSYEALKKGTDIKDWLKFWITFGMSGLLIFLLDNILYDMAIYPEMKIGWYAFLIFGKGGRIMYDSFLEENIGKAAAFIKEKLNKAKAEAKKATGQ